MHLDRLERDVLNGQIIAAQIIAAGGEDVTMPDLVTARAEFDLWLGLTVKAVDERDELHALLGVA